MAVRAGATSANFADATATTWLRAVHAARPDYTWSAVQLAVAAGANRVRSRAEFLDLLARAIVETCEELEPIYVGIPYLRAMAERAPADEAATRETATTIWGPIGRAVGLRAVGEQP